MNPAVLLTELGAVLLGLAIVGRLANRVGLSPSPLYLLAGLAFGKGGLMPLSASEDFVQAGAEIGVVLLLLLLGLEYSPDELAVTLRGGMPMAALDAVLNTLPGAALALLLGWGPVAALTLAGVTWVSSSGVIAKMLYDLGRLGNRETPTVLGVLVMEDLAMALYLPLLTAVLAHEGLAGGALALAAAIGTIAVILLVALRHSHAVSTVVAGPDPETLLLGVLGLTLLVAGIAQRLQVSAAVGAFLVGIAISGEVAHSAAQVLTPLRDLFAAVFFVFFGLHTAPSSIPPVLLPALGLAAVTIATKVLVGYVAARRAGIGRRGRWRAGAALTPRGEFSVVIAGLAVTAGLRNELAALATAYVLITVVAGPVLARLTDRGTHRAKPVPEPLAF